MKWRKKMKKMKKGELEEKEKDIVIYVIQANIA